MAKITRKFKITDANLLQYAQVMRRFFVQDQALFADFDASLTLQSAAKLQDTVDEVTLMSDDKMKAILNVHTSTVEKQVKSSKKVVKQVRYFARKAFQNKPSTLGMFGFQLFLSAQRSQARLSKYMKQLHETTMTYENKLRAVGATNKLFTSVASEANLLANSDHNQEMFKLTRVNTTLERIKMLNEIWTFIQRVEEVASFIFEDNIAKRRLYIPPRRRSSTPDNGISVPRNSQVQVLNETITEPTSFDLTNTGATPLAFYLVEQLGSEIPQTLTWVNPNETLTFHADAFPNGTPSVLVVLNENPEYDGLFEVETVMA